MRFRNMDNWADRDADRGLVFFAQRMDEITFAYTIDSYRAPTMSPSELAEECLREIKYAKRLGKEASSVSHLVNELISRIKSNPVVRSLLSLKIEFYTNCDMSSLDELERRIKLLSGEISAQSYILHCFSQIELACARHKKSEIEFLIRETVSTLCNLGVSVAHINQSVVNHFFRDKEIHGIVSLKDFFREVFPHYHRFSVLFITDSCMISLSREIFENMGIEIHSDIPADYKGKKGSSLIRRIRKGEYYVLVKELQSIDKFSAVVAARAKVQRIHDLFGLFHHKEVLFFDEFAYTLQACCDHNLSRLEVYVNNMQFAIDNTPTEAATKLERLAYSIKLPLGPDSEKFFRVVAFHGSSGQSSSIETQIVNIWTALETMSPFKKGGSIIGSVSSAVLPIIGLNYFYRIFRNLTFDLVRWDRKCLRKALRSSFVPENGDLIDKVFCLIVLPENEGALSNLFTDLKDFELLRYRAYCLNNEFKSPSRAHDKLKMHQERVKWQVHRIYRTRNAIIHTGITPSNAASLFLNAHDYFDQVFEISSALCSGTSGYDNYDDAFNFAHCMFEQYSGNIGSFGKFDLKSSTQFLWRPPSRPDPIPWLED